MTNIDLWKKHLLENPMEVIEVVAVLAATSPYLTIEEDDEETPNKPHADQGNQKEPEEGNQVSEQSTSSKDIDG